MSLKYTLLWQTEDKPNQPPPYARWSDALDTLRARQTQFGTITEEVIYHAHLSAD